MIAISKFLKYVFCTLLIAGLNFTIFMYSYKYLAFPFLHEEQRMDNAPYIFMYILPCFIASSFVAIVIYHLIINKKSS